MIQLFVMRCELKAGGHGRRYRRKIVEESNCEKKGGVNERVIESCIEKMTKSLSVMT